VGRKRARVFSALPALPPRSSGALTLCATGKRDLERAWIPTAAAAAAYSGAALGGLEAPLVAAIGSFSDSTFAWSETRRRVGAAAAVERAVVREQPSANFEFYVRPPLPLRTSPHYPPLPPTTTARLSLPTGSPGRGR
jgi:hypothetical protein